MAQMILDVGYGVPAVKHIYCPAVTKAMDRIDVFKPFGRKGLFEILPAYAVNAMASEFLSPLIDKEPVLILILWGDTVFSDIELKQMTGLGLKLYKPEPISLSKDS